MIYALGASASVEAQGLASEAPAHAAVVTRGVETVRVPQAILERRVTLTLSGASMDEALRAVARAADLSIVYSQDILPAKRRVRLEAEDMPVADALATLLRGSGLAYAVTATGQLTVRPERPPEVRGRIVGRVTQDGSGGPLADVHIVVDGINRRTRTGAGGEFVIADLAAGEYTILALKIGFARASQKVRITSGDTLVRVGFSLKPTVSRLGEVVVTSSVVETQVRQLPVDVAVVTADQIREKNITNIQQIFRGDVPGIFIEDQGYRNVDPLSARTPQVRGQNFLSASDGSTSTLKVYLDGVELSSYSVVAQLDPNSIERIEIIRGPAATTMYGSGASDGVVQIFTKRGTLGGAPRVTATMSAKTFDSPYVPQMVVSPRADLTLTGGSDGFSYSASAGYEREGEWVPDYKHDRKSVGLGMNWETGRFRLGAAIRYDGPNAYNSPPDPFYALGLYEGRMSRVKLTPLYLVPSHTVSTARTQTTSLTLGYRATSTWHHNLTVGNSNYTVEREQTDARYTTAVDTLLSLLRSDAANNTIHYDNSWIASRGDWLRSSLTTGVEFTSRVDDYQNTGNLLRSRGSLGGNITASHNVDENTGYFAQWELGLRDALYVTSGVRAEQNPNYGKDVGLRYAPRFGLAYVLEKGEVTVKLRGAYGWASRPPRAFQKDGRATTSTQSGNDIIYQHNLENRDLLPAENRGGDYGVDLSWGNWFSFSATYLNSVADKDVLSSTVVDTVQVSPTSRAINRYTQFQNVGEVETRGWELRNRLGWREWSLTSTYTSADNYVRSMPPQGIFTGSYANLRVGDRLQNVPRFHLSSTVAYSTPATQANLQVTMQGRYRATDQATAFLVQYGVPELFGPAVGGRNIPMPRWAKYNLNLTQQVYRDVSLLLSVQNLFDSRSPEGYDNRMPLAGRVIMLGSRWANR